MAMKSAYKLLAALVLALVLGIIASVSQNAVLLRVVSYVEPAGALWIGFLKMVVVPLLVSLLITSVAGRQQALSAAPLLKKTLLVFGGLYVLMAMVALLLTPLLLQVLPASLTFDSGPGDAAALAAAKPLTLTEQLLSWVPENPFRAAADGAVLPLVVFSLLFGLALNHVAAEQRAAVVTFFSAVANAMLQIVEWVLVLAPLGIFCIVFPLASRMGAQLAGSLGLYVLTHLVLYAVCLFLLYLLTALLTRTSAVRFMRACAPPQLIALGTQSSIATLPAMIRAAEDRLHIAPTVANTVLPLAVSVFKMGTVAANVVYVLFAAHLYHIELSVQQYVLLFIMSIAMSVAGAGLPSGASFLAPVLTLFTAVGVPVQIVPVLFALDTLPDMGNTVANVTADLSAVTIVAEGKEKEVRGEAAGARQGRLWRIVHRKRAAERRET